MITRATQRNLDVEGDEAAPQLFGYAIVFDSQSLEVYDADVLADTQGNPIPFVEVVDRDALTRTLRDNPDIVALYNHETSSVLGRTSSGTLELGVDEIGLWFRCFLPDTTAGRDARESVRRRDIRGCSFGFCVREDKVELRPDLAAIRTLLDVDLFEITIATAFPAYPETTTEARNQIPTNPPPRSEDFAAYYTLLLMGLV